MQATNEIRNILAKGQAKAGANPLAVLDGIMSGDALEAVVHEAPTGNPYVAYFNKGIVANPAVVVAELVSTGGGARIELTAFTAKVGLVQGHSCNAAIDKLAKLL